MQPTRTGRCNSLALDKFQFDEYWRSSGCVLQKGKVFQDSFQAMIIGRINLKHIDQIHYNDNPNITLLKCRQLMYNMFVYYMLNNL